MRRGLFCLDFGVEGLGLGLGLELGVLLGLVFLLPGVKKEVIWRCGLTMGDRPLLRRRDGAIGMDRQTK